MSFKADLSFGHWYEKKLIEILPNDSHVIKEGKFLPYDIEIVTGDITTKYEVKADRMTKTTGNIAIEYECMGRPSGITTTEADYYAYFIIKNNANVFDLYIIPTIKIRELIEEKKYKRSLLGGDFNRSRMYLFDITLFSDYLHNS